MSLARILLALAIAPLLWLVPASGADDEKVKNAEPRAKPPVASIRKGDATPAIEFDEARETEALTFVRDHHPELATVLEALKPRNPAEYRKGILELSHVGRTLAEVKARNPARHEIALEAWKAKSRVELLAAQLAGSPSEEARSQLRQAIEAKVEVEIRRQRFELEQAEANAKRARESLDYLEKNRDTVVENRFRALQPKKSAKAKKPAAVAKPAKSSKDQPAAKTPNGEDRR